MNDPFESRRPFYQAELAGGVERFLEPRRDTCPWCGSTDLSIRLRTSDLIQRKPGRFTLEQCGTCQHIFQNPRLTPAGLNFYYRDFYDGLGQKLMEQLSNGAEQSSPGQQSYRGRINMLKPFTTPRTWLDVGAAHGQFCRHARDVWPNTIFDGLDQSISIEEAQQRGWIDHEYRGEFIALAGELTGRYDVISMHHYLEHTREPFDELDTAAKVLPDGGYLLIELPDPESFFSHLLGRWWLPWLQPQHQHMIPIRNLVEALTDRGLSAVAIERGPAHQVGADLCAALALAFLALAPDPRLPWLTTEPTHWRRRRHTAVWAVGRPVLVGTYFLDMLLGQVIRRTHGANAYRVLARKDG
jgi:SAM-dependent methyltransferase